MSTIQYRILAGSGRSGTTWLQDVLCQANGLSAVFEPLHPAAWKNAVPFARKYANNSDHWPQLRDFWHQIAQRQYSKIWSIYRVRPDRLRPNKDCFKGIDSFKRYLAHWLRLVQNQGRYQVPSTSHLSLIKVIRANLMLPYVLEHLNSKIAFIVRHPAAVVESQLRLGGDWNATRIAAHYANDPLLERRLGHQWTKLTELMRSEAEVFTLIWCLENLIPIEDLEKQDGVKFLFYEHLVTPASMAWGILLEHLGLERMPESDLLQKPSQQASENLKQVKSLPNEAEGPLKRLTETQKQGIERVLNMFEFKLYDMSHIEPQTDNVVNSRPWRESMRALGVL